MEEDTPGSLEASVDAGWEAEVGPGDTFKASLTPPSPEPSPKPAEAAAPAPAEAAPGSTEPSTAPASPTPAAPAAPAAARDLAAENADLMARLSRLESEVTTLRPTAPAPAAPTDAAPAAPAAPEVQPLPDIAAHIQQLDSTMTRVTDEYFTAEKALADKRTELGTQVRKLQEIQEELQNPFDDTDSVALDAQAKRLQRQIGKLQHECRQADGEAQRLQQLYHGQLKPEMERMRVTEALANDLHARRSAEAESGRTARLQGHVHDFETAGIAAAADRAVVPEELAESFLGTKANNYEDGWLKPHCRAYLRPLPDGSGRYTVISDWPKFCAEAAKTFMAQSKRINAGFGAHYAKTRGNGQPTPGPGQVGAPAAPGTPTLTHESLEDAVDAAWDKEPTLAAH